MTVLVSTCSKVGCLSDHNTFKEHSRQKTIKKVIPMKLTQVFVILSMLVLVVACGQPAAQPAVPAQPAEPATTQPSQPSTPTTTAPVVDTSGCLETPEKIMALCKLATLPIQSSGCVFTQSASEDGTVLAGDITITQVSATVSDYEQAYKAIYNGDEDYELKPRSTRREKFPYSYFFWFTGKELVTVKATSKICPSDREKMIMLDIQSQLAAS